MTTLIAEELLTTKNLDKDAVDQLLLKVRRRTIELRNEICQLVENEYTDKLPKYIDVGAELAKNIQRESLEIQEQTNRFRQMMRDLDDAWNVDKIKQLQTELASANSKLQVLRELADVHERLEELEKTETTQRRDYLKRSELLSLLADFCKAYLLEHRKRLNSSDEMREKYHLKESMLVELHNFLIIHKETLTFDLYEEWKETFRWKTENSPQSIQLIVRTDVRLENYLKALCKLDLLPKKTDSLANGLLSEIFKPLIAVRTYSLSTANADSTVTSAALANVELTLTKNDREASSDEILSNCRVVLEQLHSCLNVKLTPNKSQQQCTFVRYLMDFIIKPFKELVVTHLLKPAIPTDGDHLPRYEQLLGNCERLMERMKSLELVSKDESSFEQFAGSIDVLFVDKRCQTILAEARRLAADTSRDTVELEVQYKDDSVEQLQLIVQQIATPKQEPDSDSPKPIPLRFDDDNRLPALFGLAKFRINSTAMKLVALIVRTLKEASSASKPLTAGRLYYCSRQSAELYLDIVYFDRLHELKTVPQFAALFFNDCHYLSHHFSLLGFEYASKLLAILDVPSEVFAVTFVDFVPRLKELASECIDMQVQSQSRHLASCLKPAAGFGNINEKSRSESCQKALNACILQLQHLDRVWRPVLTPAILLKLHGSLVSELLNNIVKSILGIDDMAAEDSQILYKMLTAFVTSLQHLFLVDGEEYIRRFVISAYLRYEEMLFMLNASLAEIEQQWQQRSVVHHLEATEIKQLIRALFQNTEQRAAVLAKIK